MNSLRSIVFIVAFLTCVMLVTAPGIAGSKYTFSADPSIDIPTKTVNYDNKEYTIGSVTRISLDDSVVVETDVPDNASYDINFRGPENQIISSERKTGDSTHRIEYFGSGEAGTYVVTIQDDGTTQAVHPVVIVGYDISVSSPDSVISGESITITAEITDRSIEKHSSLEYVEVVIGNNDTAVQQRMEQIDNQTYTTTVSSSDLDTRSYNLSVAVRGNAEVRQQAEILGFSDPVSITITERDTSTATETGSGSGGPASGATKDEATTTLTPSPTTTQPPAMTEQQTSITDQPPRTTDSLTLSQSTPTSVSQTTSQRMTPLSPSTDTTDNSSGILDPNSSPVETTTNGTGPGFTLLLTGFAVLLSVHLQRRI